MPAKDSPCYRLQQLAEMGFIIVRIDGMGTSDRSKMFHDVCWKNLGVAGVLDRVLWHKAAAEKYPYYIISRVVIYGNSTKGRNTHARMPTKVASIYISKAIPLHAPGDGHFVCLLCLSLLYTPIKISVLGGKYCPHH